MQRYYKTFINYFHVFIFFLLIMFPSCLIQANDGFFWGAGNTLQPIQNKNLRVINEDLQITHIKNYTCYTVLYQGKPQQPSNEASGGFATIGNRLDCGARENAWASFSPNWMAEAIYEIEALEDTPDVLFGFPVPTWEADYHHKDGQLDGIPAPGVVNFHTYIDSKTVGPLELHELDGVGAAGKDKTLGYTWKASFTKGHRYVLRTTYEFGTDTSNSVYEDWAYLKGEEPWFLHKGDWGISGASRLIYYLTPLRQWASPPPSRVSIIVNLPDGIPMAFAVPLRLKPVCVGVRSLFYELQNMFPDQDLEISYPNNPQGAFEIPSDWEVQTPSDWEAWIKTMGGSKIEMNCALWKHLKDKAGSDLKKILSTVKCRPSCK